MLATLAALHLIVLIADAPAAGPNPPMPDKRSGRGAPTVTLVPAASPPVAQADPTPPPPAESAPAAPPPAAEPVPPPPSSPPARTSPPASTGSTGSYATPAAGRGGGGFTSLLGAESLRGGSLLEAEAGWALLAARYAQGISNEDDAGALFEFDWSRTELRAGGFYRRTLGQSGPWTVAARFGVNWFANFGANFVYDHNRNDRGLELAPGLSLSTRAGGGLLSLLGDVPLTVTFHHGGGLLFIPRATVAYEAPLYDQFTLGARAGVAWRAGSGDAPLKKGRGDLQFLIVGSWQIF